VIAPILSACVVEEPKRMLHGELAKTGLSGCSREADDLHRPELTAVYALLGRHLKQTSRVSYDGYRCRKHDAAAREAPEGQEGEPNE
jgi:hypothetical protein